jgi:thioredoxin 1
MVTKINSEDFRLEVENSDEISIVDFFATWCGPCKMLSPIFEQLSDEMNGQAKFFKVDIDENVDLARQFNVSSVPTMIIFRNGEVLDRLVGFVPKENIIKKIQDHLQPQM